MFKKIIVYASYIAFALLAACLLADIFIGLVKFSWKILPGAVAVLAFYLYLKSTAKS